MICIVAMVLKEEMTISIEQIEVLLQTIYTVVVYYNNGVIDIFLYGCGVQACMFMLQKVACVCVCYISKKKDKLYNQLVSKGC